MNPRMRIPVLAALCAVPMLLAGCGISAGVEQPPSSASPQSVSPSASPSSQTATVDLKIVIRADGKTESAGYSLTCAGTTALESGTHPSATEACALLAGHPRLLDPAPGNQMCTEQYGGPATASVTGTVDGKAVDKQFDLKNGCGISAWNDALPLLGEKPSAGN